MIAWLSERPYDLVVIVILVGLLGCIVQRVCRGIANVDIFLAHVFVAFGLTCSLYPVYNYLDPLLGGHNILNLFERLGIGVSMWLVTRALSTIFSSLLREEKAPHCGSRGWLLVIVLGLIGSFIGMDAQWSSRGLDSYASHNPFYLLYQFFTILGFLAGAPYLVPRLWARYKRSVSRYLRWQSAAFIVGYVGSVISMVLYLLAWVSPVFVPSREIAVYVSIVAFIVAFFMVIKEKEQQYF